MTKYIAWYSAYGLPNVGVPFHTQYQVEWNELQRLGESLTPAKYWSFEYCEVDSHAET
jgi:hypothetical protein